MTGGRSFSIEKQEVYRAWQVVRANRGAAGVDCQEISDFESNLKKNLYKVWNRMSSGSYMAPPVREVLIPKSSGGRRSLGIPTVGDRVAQQVVVQRLSPLIEPYFHQDSYGSRTGKSAHDALEVTRKRCWQYDWVIDLDIQAFFDNIDHELLMKTVKHHVKDRWILLYIQRWLKAPVQKADGRLQERTKGTPQGGVISPLLANLFLHYVFDKWMDRCHKKNPFEWYVDDIIIHCRTKEEAKQMLETIKQRFSECHLQLHPTKTKIVYCKSENRKDSHKTIRFDFLGYSFGPRLVRSRHGNLFLGYTAAPSKKSRQRMKQGLKALKIARRIPQTIEQLAKLINPLMRGWINYYSKFNRSKLWDVARYLNQLLVTWARRKFKKLKRSWRLARKWIQELARCKPTLFVHWKIFGSYAFGRI